MIARQRSSFPIRTYSGSTLFRCLIYHLFSIVVLAPLTSLTAEADPAGTVPETHGAANTATAAMDVKQAARAINSETHRPTNAPATIAYTQQITKLIKATWAHRVESNAEARYGSVVVHLLVDRQGQVIDPKIKSGSPDQSLRQVALQAIKDSRLPAMPNEVVKELNGRRLALEVTFDLIAAPDATRKPAPH